MKPETVKKENRFRPEAGKFETGFRVYYFKAV